VELDGPRERSLVVSNL